MATALNISQIENDDVDALVVLVNSAYRGESSKKGWTTEADLLGGLRTNKKAIQDMLRQQGAIILTAKTETDRLVGCVYLHQKGDQLYLGMLTVAPDIQAKGIGNQLLLAAEKYAREINCTVITMTVIDVRHELIDWYKRKGFQSTGEIRPFPTDPEFGLPMQPLQFTVLEKKI
jgi:ribosomal protein S18 acetylase RimI-like enzyme